MKPLPQGQWVPIPDHPVVPPTLLAEGAYLPHPLPEELELPPSTYRLAAEAEHALGRLDEAAQRLGVRAEFVRTTRVRDVYNSIVLTNELGATGSLTEALIKDLHASQNDLSTLPNKMQPYFDAYDHGLVEVSRGAHVDAKLIAKMSAIMIGRPGGTAQDLLRTDQGWLGRSPDDAYLLTASGAHLVGLLEQWSTWVQDEQDQPRIVKIAVAHYQLEVLQPFPLANGHVTRIYSTMELVRSKLLRDQVLSLAEWLNEGVDEYQRQIRAVVDTGRIDRWVDFFAYGVRERARAQLRLLTALDELDAEFAAKAPHKGTLPQLARRLLGYPVINHRAIRETYGVSMKQATNITNQLVALGILRTWEGRRYRQVFCCEPVLKLLTFDPDTTPARPWAG